MIHFIEPTVGFVRLTNGTYLYCSGPTKILIQNYFKHNTIRTLKGFVIINDICKYIYLTKLKFL